MRRIVLLVLLLVLWVPSAAAWTWPVGGSVLQGFSFDRAHPYAGGQHRGVDLGAANGAAVLAPASGVVSFAGTVPTSGKSVTIETPDGLSVTLTHLGSIAVARNAAVAEGAVVGTVGPSGTAEVDGPYVHLGIRTTADDQGYLDPLGFLPVLAPPMPAPVPASVPPPVAPEPAAPEPAAPEPAAPPAEAASPAVAPPPVVPPPPVVSPPAELPQPAAPESAPPTASVVAASSVPAAAPPAEPVVASAPQAEPLSAPVPETPPAAVEPPATAEPSEVSEPSATVEPSAAAEPAVGVEPPGVDQPLAAAEPPLQQERVAAPHGELEPSPEPGAKPVVELFAVPGRVLPREQARAPRTASPVARPTTLRPVAPASILGPTASSAPATGSAAPSVGATVRSPTAAAAARHRARSFAPLVLVGLALLALCGLASAGLAAARIIRSPSPTFEGARPVTAVTEDPRRARVAVREWAAPHRPRGGLRRARGRVRPLSPAEGQRRADGQRDGRARHTGDGVRRPQRRIAA